MYRRTPCVSREPFLLAVKVIPVSLQSPSCPRSWFTCGSRDGGNVGVYNYGHLHTPGPPSWRTTTGIQRELCSSASLQKRTCWVLEDAREIFHDPIWNRISVDVHNIYRVLQSNYFRMTNTINQLNAGIPQIVKMRDKHTIRGTRDLVGCWALGLLTATVTKANCHETPIKRKTLNEVIWVLKKNTAYLMSIRVILKRIFLYGVCIHVHKKISFEGYDVLRQLS